MNFRTNSIYIYFLIYLFVVYDNYLQLHAYVSHAFPVKTSVETTKIHKPFVKMSERIFQMLFFSIELIMFFTETYGFN